MKRMELFPLFCVSGDLNYGMQAVLTEIVELMPTAFEMEELHAFKGAEGDKTVEIHAEDDGPFAAHVFKTMSEPHVGDVSLLPHSSPARSTTARRCTTPRANVAEKMNHLSVPQGKERIEVPRLHAGDIGCVAKLRNTHTNDTLSTREHPVRLPQIDFPGADDQMAVHATDRADEEKLQQGFIACTTRIRRSRRTTTPRRTRRSSPGSASGISRSRMAQAQTEIRRDGRAHEAADRVSRDAQGQRRGAGPPQEAVGRTRAVRRLLGAIRAAAARRGLRFVDEIVGGSIPRQFIPAVDRGIQEASARGVLAGYPLVDFQVELFDGSYHSVDSNEMSFKMAGILAFKTVAPKCKPVLLEPLDEIEVTTPDDYMGDVLGDLSSRRGHILGTEPATMATTMIRAIVPQAELHSYASSISVDDAGTRDVQAALQRLRGSAARSRAEGDRGAREGTRGGAGRALIDGTPRRQGARRRQSA